MVTMAQAIQGIVERAGHRLSSEEIKGGLPRYTGHSQKEAGVCHAYRGNSSS
jgi:hypothetical protein